MPDTKERPILFSGPMVRAILAGRKTVTRRPVKNTGFFALDPQYHGEEAAARERAAFAHSCPYGQPGDRLWVRETFALLGNEDGVCIDWNDNMVRGDERGAARIYRASCEVGDYGLWQIPDKAFWKPDTDGMQYEGAWRPSIHMPRWASRILLEITAVRVERLQDISYESARAEGVQNDPDIESGKVEGCILTSKALFECLWCDTYGDESWFANPWVWVVEFKRVEL